MKRIVMLGLTMLLLTGCNKKQLIAQPKLPSFNPQIESKLYYESWGKCENELKQCADLCQGL